MDAGLSKNTTIKLSSGNKIPIIGYGTYQLDGEDCIKGVQHALAAGYTHIDTATIYKNAAEIRKAIELSGVPRQKLYITSKVSPYEQGYDKSMETVKSIIESLDCGYLDLILIHWPGVSKMKPDDKKIQQIRLGTWRGLIEMQKQKLVKDIGVSNFLKNHLEHLIQKSGVKPAVNQFQINPCLWQAATIKFCKQNNIAIEAYSPLARQDDKLFKSAKMNSIASKHKKSVAQISLRWCLENGFIILPKSKTEARILQNIDIFDFKLDKDDMETIETLRKKNLRTCWNPHNVKY